MKKFILWRRRLSLLVVSIVPFVIINLLAGNQVSKSTVYRNDAPTINDGSIVMEHNNRTVGKEEMGYWYNNTNSVTDEEARATTTTIRKVNVTSNSDSSGGKNEFLLQPFSLGDKTNNNTNNSSSLVDKPTMTQQEQRRLPIPFTDEPHFLMHIPKTAGSYAWMQLNQLTQRYYPSILNRTRITVCNLGRGVFAKRPSHYHRKQCRMWMSERPYSYIPNEEDSDIVVTQDNTNTNNGTTTSKNNKKKVYTILRKPQEHVLSQYFHCMESKDHAHKRGFMPLTMDEWLQAFVPLAALKYPNKTAQFLMKQKYQCYDPINMQSTFLEINSTASIWRHIIFNNDTTNNILNKTLIKNELHEKFHVLGDQSQLEKTICAMFISYIGIVPDECHCGNAVDKHHRRRHLGARATSDHGVVHHGGSYQPTANQTFLLTQLTHIDRIIYQYGREVFDEQVQTLEEQYQFQMCDQPRLLPIH